jgi:hypothetical protein
MENWLNTAIGRSFNPDKTYGLQCKDVIDDYAMALWPGKSWVETVNPNNAKDVFDAAPDAYWVKTRNNPNDANQFPKRGDVVVWNGNMGGGFGHIAVVLEANANSLTVVEQDGFKNIAAYKKTYKDYSNVIGWMTPKISSPVINQPLGGLMTPEFIKATYYKIDARTPSQQEIDFHMAKSNPESFVNGFGIPKWVGLEKDITGLRGDLDAERTANKNLKDELVKQEESYTKQLEKMSVDHAVELIKLQEEAAKNPVVITKSPIKVFFESQLSRKYLLAIIAAIIAFGNAAFNWGLTQDQVLLALAPILTWMGFEGVRDIKQVESK